MTGPGIDRRAQAMQSLAEAVDEAATMPWIHDGTLRRVGDVIEALAAASLEMRLAYWGYPHPGSVGDQPLVIRVDGREFIVTNVAFDGHRIQVVAATAAPPAAADDDEDDRG